MNKKPKSKKGMMKKFWIAGIIIVFLMLLIVLFFFSRMAIKIYYTERINQISFLKKSIADMEEKLGPNTNAMLDLWRNHPDELHIEYRDPSYVENYDDVLFQTYGRNVDELLNDFPELDYEAQLKVAEYYYMYFLKDFNKTKDNLGAAYYSLMFACGGEEWQFLFSGVNESEMNTEIQDEIYVIGEKDILPIEAYSALYLEPDEGELFTMENFFEKDRIEKDIFIPVTIGGEEATIGVVFDISENLITVLNYGGTYILVLLIILGVISLVISLSLQHGIIVPVTKTDKAVISFMETMDSSKLSGSLLSLKARDEIGSLCDNFSLMGQRLNFYFDEIRKITREEEKIKAEMELASNIQQSLLDKDKRSFPEEWNLELFKKMMPAKDVGGDFYDYKMLDDDHLCLIVGDVSGKGVPAALYMMICMALFSNEVEYSSDTAEIVTAVNTRLQEYRSMNMMVTAWVGVYEISTGILKMTNAGHEYPMVIHPNGEVEIVPFSHDIVMGVVGNTEFKEYEISLSKGDIFVIYTDGVVEAHSPDDKMIGKENLVLGLREYATGALSQGSAEDGKQSALSGTLSAEDVGRHIFEMVKNHQSSAPQYDDATVLVFKC